MPKIKVTLISGPTQKVIATKCPGCGTSQGRQVPLDRKSGTETCGICRTKFKWEEESG